MEQNGEGVGNCNAVWDPRTGDGAKNSTLILGDLCQSFQLSQRERIYYKIDRKNEIKLEVSKEREEDRQRF